MNRRSAFGCLLAAIKTAFLPSFVLGADEAAEAETAAKTVARRAGPRWNVNGDWTPSLEAIQRHLLQAHGIDPTGYSLDEMLALHDNDHNRMGYRPGSRSRPQPKSSARGYRKA
jgi:hypothetical protein